MSAQCQQVMGYHRVPDDAANAGAHVPPNIERIRQRLSRFWLGTVVATVLLGAISALSNYPALRQSGKGVLLAILSILFLAWFVWLIVVQRRFGRPTAWRRPVLQTYVYLAVGLALSAGLLWIDRGYAGVVYVVIGVAVAMLPTRQTYLPIVAAAIIYITAMVPNWWRLDAGNLTAIVLNLFFLGLGIGVSFSIVALMRERYAREALIVELQDAHRRLRASAAQEADLAALRERARLAREMHDSLGHALVLIAIKIEAAQRLQAVDPPRAAQQWEETKALVRSTMADLRSSLAGMRLPALEEQPFADAIRTLCCELGRNATIDVDCVVDDEAALLDRPVQETLYRVAQEALANVAKHAGADRVFLHLQVTEPRVVLEVGDNGIGLGASERSGGHYGVIGMRERVEALGGVFTLGPRAEGGTLLRAAIPTAAPETVGV